MHRIQAVFDGSVLRPNTKLDLAPNTLVELVVVVPQPSEATGKGFLDVAEQAKLEGPEDWSENLDSYLYQGKSVSDG